METNNRPTCTFKAERCEFSYSFADNGWIDHTCSNCGYIENTDIHVSLGWNFCPVCGARIENEC